VPKLFGHDYTRDQLMRRIGAVSQVGGVRLAEFGDGRAKGVSVVDFNLGNGFEFSVLPDRGMDVFDCRYQGMSLAWHSVAGVSAPSFYEPQGLGWLRTFGGGLLATCGLTHVGAPTVDEGVELGLHGRAHVLPASGVQADGAWEGDEYAMWATGTTRESVLFGANLSLQRRISARLGETRFRIDDVVRNDGYRTTPHQVLYHINTGFPLLDAGSRLLSASSVVTPRDAEARKDGQEYNLFTDPVPGYAEKVYYHDMATDGEGYVRAAVINFTLWHGEPFGLYVKYRKEQLPRFVEWKMMGEGDYVVGMEPANCGVQGRTIDREQGLLDMLEPGAERRYSLEIGLIVGESEYRAFRKSLPL
jgi:hypothetical protein